MHAAVGGEQPGAGNAPDEGVGAAVHEIMGVAGHVGAVEAAEAEMDDAGADAGWVEFGARDGGRELREGLEAERKGGRQRRHGGSGSGFLVCRQLCVPRVRVPRVRAPRAASQRCSRLRFTPKS